MSTYSELKSIFYLERKFDINKYKFKNIELWPLVRENFLSQYISQIKKKEIKDLSTEKITIKSSKLHLKILINSSYKILRFKKNLNLYRCDFFFLGSLNNFYDSVNNKLYDRFLDPYIELISNDYKWIKVIPVSSKPKENIFYNYSSVDSSIFKEFTYSKYFFYNSYRIKKKIRLIENELSVKINSEHFRRKFIEIMAFYKLFSIIFKICKPKISFFISYYSAESFGLILAAKKYNIKTAEIQHGKNGKYNHMLSHLSNFPMNGFKLLPDYFLTWGDFFSKEINKYYPDKFIKHQPISIGNLWISRFKELKYDQKKTISIFKDNSKNIILFSLQSIHKDDVIPNWLSNYVKKHNDYNWLFRLHPTQHYNDVNWKGCDNLNYVNIQEASEIPLYNLLKITKINITLWSSVAIEALNLGIKTIIIHQEGKRIYEDQLYDGDFEYCDNESIFDNCLKSNLELKFSPIECIQTDRHKIEESFFKFINSI